MTAIAPENTDVLTLPDVVPYDETDDGKDHLTHIINPPGNPHIWQPGMEAQDIVDTARLMGWSVTALCGYTWIPKRNPDKYPVCDTCMTIAGDIMREAGE